MREHDPTTPRAALAHLRAHRQATLLADEMPHTLRTVIDGRAGTLVANVPPVVLEAEQLVLMVPEENPELGPALHLLVAAQAIDPERSASCDRWLATHGPARHARWIDARVETARFEDAVIDGDEWPIVNPLAAIEPALLRTLNADRARLARLARARCGIDAPDALAVAVDPDGIDVRTGSAALPLRVDWPEGWLETPDAAAERLAAFLRGEGPWTF